MARQRFEDTVKNLIKRKPKTDSKTIKTKKAKVKEDIPEQFGLFMKCKCTLEEMNDYHPNKGIAVRVRDDALYYKWTFKHFSIAIQLYSETVNITFLDRSNMFERYFEEGIHISKYDYQKRNNKFANKNLWDIEQAKQSPFSVGLEFKQPVLYINAKSEGGEDWAIKTITPHLQNILSTFEELDRGIEEYNKKQAKKQGFEETVKSLKQRRLLPQEVKAARQNNAVELEISKYYTKIASIFAKKHKEYGGFVVEKNTNIYSKRYYNTGHIMYEWTFLNFRLNIRLYKDYFDIMFEIMNKEACEKYFDDKQNKHFNQHNANDSLWRIISHEANTQHRMIIKHEMKAIEINIHNNFNVNITNCLYIKESFDSIKGMIPTFEELDNHIESYKHANKVAKSTVKKITENLKPKKENTITYENVMKHLKNDWKTTNKVDLEQVALNREFSRLNKKYKHFELTLRVYNNKMDLFFSEPSIELCEYIENNKNFLGFLIMAHSTKLYPNFNIQKIYRRQSNIMSIDLDSKNIEIAYLDNHNFRYGAQEINMPYSQFKDMDHFIQLVTFFEELDKNVSLNMKPKEKATKKPTLAEVAKEKVKAIKEKKKEDIISIDIHNESAIEKEWKALTHEQWMEKSEAARLKLIAAISKDRQVPFVQVKNEESKVITCIQINALDKLPVKDLEDVLTRIEDATQVLNKEKAHKETLIKSIHTKYEEYSKLYKEIKGE